MTLQTGDWVGFAVQVHLPGLRDDICALAIWSRLGGSSIVFRSISS